MGGLIAASPTVNTDDRRPLVIEGARPFGAGYVLTYDPATGKAGWRKAAAGGGGSSSRPERATVYVGDAVTDGSNTRFDQSGFSFIEGYDRDGQYVDGFDWIATSPIGDGAWHFDVAPGIYNIEATVLLHGPIAWWWLNYDFPGAQRTYSAGALVGKVGFYDVVIPDATANGKRYIVPELQHELIPGNAYSGTPDGQSSPTVIFTVTRLGAL